MSLPALVVFSVSDSNKEVRYLSFTGPQRQLRCSLEEGVFNDNVRFAVEPAGDGLVHIRSTYENCYWTRPSRFEPWLTASAREKVEDMSKEECTLFRPRMSQGNVFVSFVHAQSNLNVVMLPSTDAHAYNLSAQATTATDFSFINFSPLLQTKLPRYVMFLEENGRYLSPSSQRPIAIINAAEFHNPTSRAVGFEVIYNKNGDFRIKSMSLDGFWTVMSSTPRYVVIDTANQPDPNDPNTIFKSDLSVQIGSGREVGMALLNRGHNLYCHRWTSWQYTVGSNTPHLSASWLRPRHVVAQDKRRVNIDSFRHAWVAPRSTRLLRTRQFNNSRHDEEWVSPVYTEMHQKRRRVTISNDIGFFRGPSAVFNGRMPYVRSDGELDFDDVASDVTAAWGTTIHTSGDGLEQYDYTVRVPPRSRITVSVVLKVATYGVPFSYQQIDESPFGGTITQDLYDGVYRIEDEYEASAETTEIRPFVASELQVNDGEIEVDPDTQNTEHEEVNAQDDTKVTEPEPEPEVNQE